VGTGENAAVRPPPLWKSCILTIIPLHIIVWLLGINFYPYLYVSGINDVVVVFIASVVNVFLNSYIGVPLMHSQFGRWLHMSRPIHPLPYIGFLDCGFSKFYQVTLLVFWVLMNVLLGNMLSS